MKIIHLFATITTLLVTSSVNAQLVPSPGIQKQAPSITKLQLIENGSKLRIYDGNIIKTIKADSLKVRVLDSITCEGKQVKRQTLSGQKFFPKTINLDKKTGNLAVGVLLQNCLQQNISAAFILQPKPNWTNYIVHRVPVPGKKQINNRFSTYPLGKIKIIDFIDGDLLIKYSSLNNSEALLVYTASNKPVGKYAGCVMTKQNKRDSICPSFEK